MRRKLIVLAAILCSWLAAAVDATTSDMPSSTAVVNSSANDSSPPTEITSPASAAPITSSSAAPITSSSSVSLSSVSSPPAAMENSSSLSSLASPSSSISMTSVSDFSMAASSSSASSAPLPTSQTATVTNALGPTSSKKSPIDVDTWYLPIIAAIISGCGLFVVMVVLLVAMALVYRHLGKKEPMMTPLRKAKKADGGLYAAQESQSAQYLVSSVSTPSFGNSPSDVRLDAHMPGSPDNLVYYNRGLDVDQRPAGAYDHEDGYKPIQIVAADVPGRPKSTSKV